MTLGPVMSRIQRDKVLGAYAVAREAGAQIFGPRAHVAVFDEEDEVVRCANDTRYGLASDVWTGDAARRRCVAGRLKAGTVWVNCWRVRDERVPFGCFKQSGIGREGGTWSLDYSELKMRGRQLRNDLGAD